MAESTHRKGSKAKAKNPRSLINQLVRVGLFFGLTSAVAGAGVGGALYLYYAPTIPKFNSLADYRPKLGTRVYSADNQLIGELPKIVSSWEVLEEMNLSNNKLSGFIPANLGRKDSLKSLNLSFILVDYNIFL